MNPTDPLLKKLQQRHWVLTPNQRLSRYLEAHYGEFQRQRGHRAWATPNLWALERWILSQWQLLQESGDPLGQALLLDNRQELQLWQQALAQDRQTQEWLQPAGAARQAQQAYKTLQLWQQQIDSPELQPYIDPEFALGRWQPLFNQLCQPLRAITLADAVSRLISAYQQGCLDRHPQLWLVSFQDIPPLYQQLLDTAFEQVEHAAIEGKQAQISRLGCDDHQHEIAQAGQWCRQVLQQIPGARIAIIDPELGNYRSEHERNLRRLLEPRQWYSDNAPQAPLFNISMGTSLADSAIINHAFELIQLLMEPIELEQLPGLLYSPYIADCDQELCGRTALEIRLRRLGQSEFSLQQLHQQLQLQQDDPELDCPALNQLFTGLLERRNPRSRSYADWSQWLVETLQALGWPGPRQASSLEYQQISQWYQLLARLGRFDTVLPIASLAKAIRLIRSETQQASFQPKTPDSAVQVLGPLEAVGQQFSHLWLMGLSDDRWPALPNLNPLLPAAYQQAMQMPHASADRELLFARQLTELFAASADQVIFSHPKRQDDQLLRPSALIKAYPASTIEQLPLSSKHCFNPERLINSAAANQQQVELELVATDRAPVISDHEKAQLRGGSALLANQALCPFSAFAIHRLGARPLERPSLGLSHAERGNLVHQALELIWRECNSQQQLASLDPDQRQQLIDNSVTSALEPYQKRPSKWMGERYWQLERQRLSQLLQRWLAIELERPGFRVIGIEKSLQTELAGMPLKLRIDRIDQLEDGSELLIDYKTGSPNSNDWFGERPRQPQLPLYLYANRDQLRHPISALAFGQINAAEVGFKGVCQQQSPAEGIKAYHLLRQPPAADWQQQQQLWYQQLEQLMIQFLEGQVEVSPLYPDAYQYSELQPLNRYYDIDRLATTEHPGATENPHD